MTSPYGAPEWAASQASPDVTVNEQARRVQAGGNHYVVADKDLTTAPGSCADGATFIVATAGGAWSAGSAKDLATAVGVDAANGWYFRTPVEGVTAYVQDENVEYTFGGASWAVSTAPGTGTAATLDFDTDGTLAANSDAKIPTQKAVKTAIAAAVVGLFDLKGGTDCSANPNYPAALKGDAYQVTVAGKIGGASGKSVDVGDVYIASADNAGGTEASVGTSWFVLEHNLVGAASAGAITASGLTMATARLLGRTTASTGAVEELTVGTGLTLSGGSLVVDQTALKPLEAFSFACSDETTAITTGTAKLTWRTPYAFTVTEVRASVTTAPTGSTILIDINEGGTTILSTKLMIDATEKTSTTAATPAVISDASLADDAEITVDFDQVGSTIAGAGVKVTIIGHRT